MNRAVSGAIVRVLKALNGYPPEPLLDEVNHRLKRAEVEVNESDLVELITALDPNEPARVNFHIQITRWDGAEPSDWSNREDGSLTLPGTPARRARVLAALELSAYADVIDKAYPAGTSDTVVIADEPEDWDPWYTSERAAEHHFYWDAYSGVLAKKMDEYAVGRLDDVTSRVVGRLADPTREAPYQSKGLVVGHVQSGKTANFTGVIAKAIDAGYRLVIVLTGTIEILRSQTQRRLDMELVGEENILGGIDPKDPDLLADIDYAGSKDRDWVEDRFVRHGVRPRMVNEPEIRRLTRASWDYKALAAGLSALDFRSGNELKDQTRPLYDPINLFGTDVRIAVVKKNARVLERLVSDLKRIHTNLAEIPVLIIDDEADQASVNTKKDKKTDEAKDRTAINKLIAQILGQLTRSQYIGYTATPFANVFVDLDDPEDIFPRDFIVSLEPPIDYMGGQEFHDLTLTEEDERTFATSNEKAYVRPLKAKEDDEAARAVELRSAIDAFVLAGALKLWRETVGETPGRFRHHTMLVHESVNQSEHSQLARLIHDIWKRAGYSASSGLQRLHDLWRSDFHAVSDARANGEPIPHDFSDIHSFIGKAVDRIATGSSPVVVVNGDKESDYQQKDLNFQTGQVWKILVGGAKLSRGFTVEGLTVSYYTRRTTAADTLMQMGRWFGYRAGYRDLVRLYIGRDVPGPRGSRVDLYKAFEAIVRDEEEFRTELRSFQGLDDEGRPKVRPIDVPPMVFQSLPWLKPTAPNKMYNAELIFKGAGGQVKDFPQQPSRSAAINERHFIAVQPLLRAATVEGEFFTERGTRYQARYGIVKAAIMKEVLENFLWTAKFDFSPTMQFFDQAVAEGTLEDWAVLLPILTAAPAVQRELPILPGSYTILKRERRDDREDVFSGSSPRQRRAMEIISGGVEPFGTNAGLNADSAASLRESSERYPDSVRLHTPTRGAFLLSFAADLGKKQSDPAMLPDPVDPADIATLFSLAFPKRSAPTGRVGFSVKVKGRVATVSSGS